MRKLSYVTVGFVSSVAVSHYLMPDRYQLYFALACVLLLFPAFFLKGKARLVAVLVMLSAALGAAWNYSYEIMFIRPAETLIGTTERVEARVLDYPVTQNGYSSVTLKLTGEGLPRCRVLVTDYDMGLAELEPGDIVSVELKFRSARERFNVEDDYYFSNGIFLRAYPEGECSALPGGGLGPAQWPKLLAHKLKAHILAMFPDDVAPLMKALMTGDKAELYEDDELYVSLRIAGLSHIIAVSGMHVSFLIAVLRLLTGRRRITAFIGIPLVWFFAAMMGFGPSVTRASLMISLLLAAPLLNRENDPPTSLSAALLLLILLNPKSIASVSLQLSFAAMAGIILVTPRIYRAVSSLYSDAKRIVGRLAAAVNGVFSASVGALIFTTPLVALHFGYVSLYSILANILCLWALSLAFMLSYPVCLIGAVFMPAGQALASVIAWLPRYAAVVARFISRLPWAVLFMYNRLIALWIVFVYAVLLLPWLLRGNRPYRPVIPLCCCVVSFPLVAVLSLSLGSAGPSVTAVDVGQGQCIIANTRLSTVVIDCGGRGSAENAGDCAAEYLLSSGRRSVDLLVLTHMHDDHANGVVRLMNYMDVKRIAIPADCETTDSGDSILEMCYDRGVEVYLISENTNMRVDSLSLELFAPIGSEDTNESGLIVYGDYGEFEFLVTGDAGSGTEKQFLSFYPIDGLDLLVVGHHGSRYSTCESFLDGLSPERAIISVGQNSYGHPTEEVLDRLYSRGIEVLRTDQNGNITVMAGNNYG